jgi:3-oxoacyl-[acyl-carrier protein] reductase
MRRALVTGGDGGIGRAICVRLAAAGYAVVSVDKHTAPDADTRYEHLAADITAQSDLESLGALLHSRGELAAVVNCAGILRAASVATWSDSAARGLFDVNFFAAARIVALCTDLLTSRSAIVNVSSIACRLADQGDLAAYGASKAALESYTRHCATQLGPRGIRVNAVAPGIIDVGMSDDMRRVALSETSPLKRCALRRMGTPEEVAECVEFLLRASYVNGTTLVVDGGLAG